MKNGRAINRLRGGRGFQRTGRHRQDVATDHSVVANVALRVDKHGQVVAQRRTRLLQSDRSRLLEHRAPQVSRRV